MIIIIMVMTKITRMIIIILMIIIIILMIIIIIIIIIMIMIIKSIKFTNVISYHKPQFKLQWDSVRVMLVNGLSYWIVCVMCMHCCHVLC